MADDAQRARALGAWERALSAYLDAADAMIRRGALAGPTEPLERILVQRHLDRPAREMLRVTNSTYLVADCATVAGVAQHVDLATLVAASRS